MSTIETVSRLLDGKCRQKLMINIVLIFLFRTVFSFQFYTVKARVAPTSEPAVMAPTTALHVSTNNGMIIIHDAFTNKRTVI